jgi:hypothetical protein
MVIGSRRNYAVQTDISSIAIGDLNGDGRPELATANVYSRTITVFVNSGGTFKIRRHYHRVGQLLGELAMGDLNRDGRLDLVVSSSTGVAVLMNTSGFTETSLHSLKDHGKGPRSVK